MRMRQIRVVLVALLGLSLSLAASSEQQTALRVSPTSLRFDGQAGGQQPDARFLTLDNTGTKVLKWRASADVDWIILGASTARIGPGQVVKLLVLADAEGLASGTSRGTITVENVDAQGSATEVAVTLTLSNPARLDLSPSSLSFSAQEGGSNPSSQTLTIKNTGGEPLNWTASTAATWLILRPSQGRLTTGSSASVSVEVDLSSLSVGSHKAQITVASPEAVNSPVMVAVTLVLSTPKSVAQLDVSPTSLSFSAEVNQSTIITKTVTIRNSGKQTLTWTATENANWFSLNRSGGTLKTGQSTALLISVNTKGLFTSTRTGSITIASPEAKNSPIQIPVTLTLSSSTTAAQLKVSLTSLSFSGQVNQNNIAARTVMISNVGGQTLIWKVQEKAQNRSNVKWLNLSRLGGTLESGQSTELVVSVNAEGLSVGTRTATITISSPEAVNNSIQIPVTLTLSSPKTAAQPKVSPLSLDFSVKEGESNPATQTLTIKNIGGEALKWTASENLDWLGLSSTSGTLSVGTSTKVALSVDVSGLSPSTYSGQIVLFFPDVVGSLLFVDVTLTLSGSGSPSSQFDSDKDGVPDAKDFCPLTPGKKDNNGCP